MKIPQNTASLGVRRLDKGRREPTLTANQSNKYAGLYLAMSLFLTSMLLSACSGFLGFGQSATPTSSTQVLKKIHWCTKPLMVFHDEGAFTPIPSPQATLQATGTASASSTPTRAPGTPETVSDWSVIKASLGFTVYLPKTLPSGACLLSAQATIHDPIFGGNFIIGYLLADHTALNISEAPLKSQSTTFQCNGTETPTPTSKGETSTANPATPSPTVATNQLCSGAKNTTNIVISGSGTVQQLQQIFNSLQPNVDWIPAS
jgi:hypothetical protein